MWIIVGLGNPGRKYERTRHNVGFRVVDNLADVHGIELKENELYKIGRGSIGNEKVVLVEPLTFMNRSGRAVRDASRRFDFQPERLVVIHDDLDMDTGRLKVKRGGGPGGHKGVSSIIQDIGSREFIRVKIGIGRNPDIPSEHYVLSKFGKSETALAKDAVHRASDAVEAILASGLEHAMNAFNRKPEEDQPE